MSSFKLTKQMKAKVALDLTVLAVKKNIMPIEKWVKGVNQEFWDNHLKRVESEVGLAADKFPHLIQLGVMSGTVLCEPVRLVDGVEREFSQSVMKHSFTDKHTLQTTLLDEQVFRGLREHFRMSYNRNGDRLTFLFRTDHTVPRMRQMENLTDQPRMIAAVNNIIKRLMEVLDAAAEFHAQTEMVLASMRTSTQLLNAFPEAAQLLPESVKVTHELAPIEQINKVREMLKTGVPQPKVMVR